MQRQKSIFLKTLNTHIGEATPWFDGVLPIFGNITLFLVVFANVNKKIFNVAIVFLAITLILSIFYAIRLVRRWQVKKFEESLKKSIKETYFIGFKVEDWTNTNAINRFIKWYKNDGFCFVLSGLAMVMLKKMPFSKIRISRGIVLDMKEEDGDAAFHSWVEIKIPFMGWFVLDLSWLGTTVVERNDYLKKLHIKPTFQCSYNEFWSHDFPNRLFLATRNAKTSYIFEDLIRLNPKSSSDLNFSYLSDSLPELLIFSGQYMVPFGDFEKGFVVSTETLCDFVKNPRRRQPKARSIRLANSTKKSLTKSYLG